MVYGNGHDGTKGPPILVFAFEPPYDDTVNLSQKVTKALESNNLPANIVFICLPLNHKQARKQFKTALQQHNPQYIFGFGEMNYESGIKLEKRALQYTRSGAKTSQGIPYIDKDPSYFDIISQSIDPRSGLKTIFSENAGTDLCNELFLESQKYMKNSGKNPQNAVFVHVGDNIPEKLRHIEVALITAQTIRKQFDKSFKPLPYRKNKVLDTKLLLKQALEELNHSKETPIELGNDASSLYIKSSYREAITKIQSELKEHFPEITTIDPNKASTIIDQQYKNLTSQHVTAIKPAIMALNNTLVAQPQSQNQSIKINR